MYQQIRADIVRCMKIKAKTSLVILRVIDSEIQLAAKESKQEITDKLVTEVLSKGIKERQKALDLVSSNKKQTDKLNLEINHYRKYLPKPLTNDEISSLIKEAINKTGANSRKQMGSVMGYLSTKVLGRADMKELSKRVISQLET